MTRMRETEIDCVQCVHVYVNGKCIFASSMQIAHIHTSTPTPECGNSISRREVSEREKKIRIIIIIIAWFMARVFT